MFRRNKIKYPPAERFFVFFQQRNFALMFMFVEEKEPTYYLPCFCNLRMSVRLSKVKHVTIPPKQKWATDYCNWVSDSLGNIFKAKMWIRLKTIMHIKAGSIA